MVLPYNLGEMKSKNGGALRYEVEAAAADYAIKISNIIKDEPTYKQIEGVLSSHKTIMYFQKVIKTEIYSAVRDYCVIKWYQRNHRSLVQQDLEVVVPDTGIFRILVRLFVDQGVCFKFVRDRSKNRLKELVKKMIDLYSSFRFRRQRRCLCSAKPMIALQYTEGFDLDRRSDIVWYSQSRIDPAQVLIYFDGTKPISHKVLRAVNDLGMRHVFLKRGLFADHRLGFNQVFSREDFWHPSAKDVRQITGRIKVSPRNGVENWIIRIGQKLLSEVAYWAAFYKNFNIKLHFITGEGQATYIAQGIAFDMNFLGSGFLVGKQRSEFTTVTRTFLGHYPADILFTWNKRAQKYLGSDISCAQANIPVGYSNDFVFKKKFKEAKHIKEKFRKNGVNFILALFDNVHAPEYQFSTEMMESFYLSILRWVLAEKDVGLIIKSKKPRVLKNLPQVIPILEQAQLTERCICLENEFGRLPVDAAAASDMVVGIGISTAVIESVISGCRGIHCDLTSMRSNEFYQWGTERIIFDDLNRLMSALKCFKEDKAKEPDLGDWSPFLDQLDPFRDGRAGERMGSYLRWCLEGFEAGLDSQAILEQANSKFTKEWATVKN